MRRLVGACSALAAATAIVALLGWWAGNPVIAMDPAVAVMVALYALAAATLTRSSPSTLSSSFVVAAACAGAVAAPVLFVLSHRAIARQLAREGLPVVPAPGGIEALHVQGAAALALFTTGLCLLVLLPTSPGRAWRARVALVLSAALALGFGVLLLARLYGVGLPYQGGFLLPSPAGAVAICALGAALSALALSRTWDRSRLQAAVAMPAAAPVAVFVLSTVGIVTAGYFSLRGYEIRYREQVEHELSSVADLKVGELVRYRNERLGAASIFLRNSAFSDLVGRALGEPADARALAQVATWLGEFQVHNRYERLSLLDRAAEVRLSLPASTVPLAASVLDRATEVLRTGALTFKDFYRDENDGRIYLTLLVPVLGGGEDRRPIAVLALRIDPEAYLYPFISRWPTPSETAESLLVRRDGDDVLFLNELRFRSDAALALRIPLKRRDVPAVKAVLGRQGIVAGKDYRGQRVIAAVRPVPGAPWFLVARLDQSEVYAPMRERRTITAIAVGALLIGAGSWTGLLWRRQRTRFYRDQLRVERDRAWLRDLIARSLNEIYAVDPDTLHFFFANAGAERGTGYTFEELTRMRATDVMPAFTDRSFRELLGPLRGGEREELTVESVHRRKDGSEYPVEMHLQLVPTGSALVLLAVVADITERKEVQKQLQLQRDLYQMLAQTDQAIVHSTGRDQLFAAVCRIAVEHGHFRFAWLGVVDETEKRVVPVVKYGDDQGYAETVNVSTNPDDPSGRGPTGRCFHTGRHAVSNDFLGDRRTAWWHEAAGRIGVRASAAFPIRERGIVVGVLSVYAGEVGFFTQPVLATMDSIVKDVSFALDGMAVEADRARVVQALRESEDRYRDLVENSRDLICTHDLDGELLSINETVVRATGYSRGTLVGSNLRNHLLPELRGQFAAYLAELRANGQARGVMRIRTAAGETRYWEFGSTVRTQEGAEPIVRGMAHDVTARLKAERERRSLEAQLRVAQKMEALGALAGGIAHDFNNILGAILGNVELVRQDVGPEHPASVSLEEIRKASHRAKELVQRILAFGRPQPRPQAVIRLRPVIEEAILLLRATLPAGVELVADFAADAPDVQADPTDIHQVLVNLCTNAWHALESRPGRVEVRLDGVTLDAEAAAIDPSLRPGRFACLSVTDDGRGMDAATLDRVFEPFFTTKTVGQGTGLGLSVVHGIVKAHAGSITVESAPGRGTTVRVYLPAAAVAAAEAASERVAAASSVPGTSFHVLYVDDEDALVFLVRRALERAGYRVTGCSRANEALAAVRADAGRFDLVVTDFNMPGMSGIEVAREIHRLRPDLPVVLASGYITDELREQALQAGVQETIYKPNTVDEMCEIVRRVAARSHAA